MSRGAQDLLGQGPTILKESILALEGLRGIALDNDKRQKIFTIFHAQHENFVRNLGLIHLVLHGNTGLW